MFKQINCMSIDIFKKTNIIDLYLVSVWGLIRKKYTIQLFFLSAAVALLRLIYTHCLFIKIRPFAML